MNTRSTDKWPLGQQPTVAMPIPERMDALTIHRDRYGAPADVIKLETVATPALRSEDGNRVLVSILASGPNFNSNLAALGLPVPVFGRGDSATLHIPGSDALGIVVDAGAAVKMVGIGQAVVLDSWTSRNIRGYETHDGFNAQFAIVDQERAIPIPEALGHHSPEQLAAMLLTYGTAYRAVVERLAVGPGDSVLMMGGGRGTSFAGAQIAKALGARVILVGSNPALAESLIKRGIADAFLDRRALPASVFGVIPAGADAETWRRRTEPFRQAVYAANNGRPVDKIFEHTGALNFPLLVSALAEGGRIAFFGATGSGLKGEYKETFFYGAQRFVLDARWVWMRQKQVIFRNASPAAMLSEIRLPLGRKGLVWGADDYAIGFVEAALQRASVLAVIASRTREAAGIAKLRQMGIPDAHIIDRDKLALPDDMPDPLTEEGRPNPAYGPGFMNCARDLGRAVWEVFGPRVSPDFVIERPDQSTLHFSTFVVRDYDERDEMANGWVLVKGHSDLSVLGSHMYRTGQAYEVIRLLSDHRIVFEPGDLEITGLEELPSIQQKMLDGSMTKPKGVALVQAPGEGRKIVDCEAAFLGQRLRAADPAQGSFLSVGCCEGIATATITRPDALNALSDELLAELEQLIDELAAKKTVGGTPVRALLLRGTGRAFMAGADITGFLGASAETIGARALRVIRAFDRLEQLPMPVVALVDGFALGGGNELAMSAHVRIVTENTQMGQPEVKLGIFPGYGGMQRLPRLVGPRKGAELILNGEPVDGHRAVAIGLADLICPSATALRTAFSTARRMADGEIAPPRRDWNSLAATQGREFQEVLALPEIASLRAAAPPDRRTAGDIKAARAYAARTALEALSKGYFAGFAAGLENDARLFGEVTASPSGQYWVDKFLLKDPQQSAVMTLLPPK